MLIRTAALFVFLLVFALAQGDEIYRWTDESGRVHYGDSAPDPHRAKAINVNNATMTDAQRQEAAARLARDRALLEKKATPVAPLVSGIESSRAADTNDAPTCEEEWKKYDDSYACFNPYRLANGAVRVEAYAVCTEVKQPERCR